MATPGLTEQQVVQLKAMLAAAADKPPPPPAWIDSLNAVADAVAKTAWPIIVAVLIWRLYPAITAIVKSRAFTLKVAGMEISVQDATEQLRAQIEDLQRQVIALKGGPAPARKAAAKAPAAPPPPIGRKILWVDDNMRNNAFQVAQLNDAGVTVVQSSSTPDAMGILQTSAPFAAVISDMGRRESGAWRNDAGLALLKEMRAAGRQEPFMIYSNRAQAERFDAQVRSGGGDGATSSAVELLQWVRQKLPPESAATK